MRPLLLALETEIPSLPGEGWHDYRRRAEAWIEPVRKRGEDVAGLALIPVLTASALHGSAPSEAIRRLQRRARSLGVRLIQWGGGGDGPWEEAEGAPRSGQGSGAAGAEPAYGAGCRGREDSRGRERSGGRVRVAVLDSGIEKRHPFLVVTESVSTCPEPSGVPGRHGTHCAGLIASRDPNHLGVAPGVRLLDVKVARASGSTTPGWLAQGVDAALDLEADILSISFGLNHLPAHLPNGHGWSCPEGHCVLCRAVERAVSLGAVVVAAAGNEHVRVKSLRERGEPLAADAELLCPARSAGALTVGALGRDRNSRHLSSSRGRPGSGKPEILAPGVDARSTVPLFEGMPTNASDLFGADSGTSVAAAIVTGAVALVIQRRRTAGLLSSSASVRQELLEHHTLLFPAEGAAPQPRILDLSNLLPQPAGDAKCPDSFMVQP